MTTKVPFNMLGDKVVADRWTPTATLGTNAAAAVPGSSHYVRLGDEVQVAGNLTIDPTATGLTVVELTLPVASDFTATTDAGGVFASTVTVDGGGFSASIANNTLVLSFIASDTASRQFYFSGMYQVK